MIQERIANREQRTAGKPSVILKTQTLQVSLYSAFSQTEEKPDSKNSEWKDAKSPQPKAEGTEACKATRRVEGGRRLKKGDVLFDSTGRQLRIRDVQIEKRTETVYNFTVEGEHDYYVGEDGVLVHNRGCGNPAEGLLGNDNVDTSISAGSGRPVSQLFEKLKNFITREGFNSDGELALKKILAPNKSGEAVNERTVIEIGGTKMIREAGSDRITMMLQGGETFTLNGPKDLERIINAAGNGKNGKSVTINSAADFNELLSRGVENYYKSTGFEYEYFNDNNKRINASDLDKEPYPNYNFNVTQQITASDPIRFHPVTGEPLDYYDYRKGANSNKAIPQDEVESYFLNIRKTDPSASKTMLLCGQIACRHVGKISLLKAYGLINPNWDALEATTFLAQSKKDREKMSDQDMLNKAVQSDWAKLTGSHQLKYTSFGFTNNNTVLSGNVPMLPLSNSNVQAHLNKRNPVIVNGSFGGHGHVSLITSCNMNTKICYYADGANMVYESPLSVQGFLYGVQREKK